MSVKTFVAWCLASLLVSAVANAEDAGDAKDAGAAKEEASAAEGLGPGKYASPEEAPDRQQRALEQEGGVFCVSNTSREKAGLFMRFDLEGERRLVSHDNVEPKRGVCYSIPAQATNIVLSAAIEKDAAWVGVCWSQFAAPPKVKLRAKLSQAEDTADCVFSMTKALDAEETPMKAGEEWCRGEWPEEGSYQPDAECKA